MKIEKELLVDQIKEYAIILDDYINKRYKYTIKSEYLENEIKVISACLLETVEEYQKILLKENDK